ncbi:MAG: kelch repeat-containing protein [Anaerolineaceae bacterium]|nr:kelch repeat-containing protein [Anaerolineaceae bacterium]
MAVDGGEIIASGQMNGGSPEIPKEFIARPQKTLRRGMIALLGMIVILALGAVGLSLRGLIVPPPEMAEPVIPRWQVKAPMPVARSGMAAVSYNGQIYTIGGKNSQGITGETECYSPVEDAWQVLPQKPLPVTNIGGAAIGGKIYIPGGKTADGEPTDVFEVYDVGQKKWDQAAKLPLRVYGYALAVFEGKIYLIGGWDGEQPLNTVYEYTPDQNTWMIKAPMPTPRGFAGAVTIGDTIYVLGGYDGKFALSVNEGYSPILDDSKSNPWVEEAPLPEGRYSMGVSSLADSIYIVGGSFTPTSSIRADETVRSFVYLPVSNLWISFEMPMESLSSDLSLVSYSRWIYLLGGLHGDIPLDQNLAYQAIYTIAIPSITK